MSRGLVVGRQGRRAGTAVWRGRRAEPAVDPALQPARLQPLRRGAGGAVACRAWTGHCGREHEHLPAADRGTGHGDVVFEGRWLRVITVAVQATVLVALTGLILGTQWLPVVMDAARAGDPGRLGWMVFWPPAWFLGLFQVTSWSASRTSRSSRTLAMPAVVMSLRRRVRVCAADLVAVAPGAARAGVGRARGDAGPIVVVGATSARVAGARADGPRAGAVLPCRVVAFASPPTCRAHGVRPGGRDHTRGHAGARPRACRPTRDG